jgi:uncharacterized protein (UPF0248 family)
VVHYRLLKESCGILKISAEGKVFSHLPFKLIERNGYMYIYLSSDWVIPLHRAVASAYLKVPLNDKRLVYHKDGNHFNNHKDNLYTKY